MYRKQYQKLYGYWYGIGMVCMDIGMEIGMVRMENWVWGTWILCTLQFSIPVWKVYGRYGAIPSYIGELPDGNMGSE